MKKGGNLDRLSLMIAHRHFKSPGKLQLQCFIAGASGQTMFPHS